MGLPKLNLTAAGATLLAKTPLGGSIPVTKWQIGTQALPPGYDTRTITQLGAMITERPIAKKKQEGSTTLITGQFTNIAMEGFVWEETGLFATDPDTQNEVLFAYGNSFGNGEVIDPGGEQLREIIFGAQFVFDVSGNLTAVIDYGLVFATIKEMEQRIPHSEKGMPLGVPTLDSLGKIPLEQLPDGILAATSIQVAYNGGEG